MSARLLADALTPAQERVLAALDSRKGNITALAEALSEETGVSEPTCRRLLQRLRDLGLASAGRRKSKGRRFRLTALGTAVLLELHSHNAREVKNNGARLETGRARKRTG
ncbi:MAG: hypothetical protein V1881_02635 [Candidatus Micrarchaeota archaeon]